ncbi:MAG: hypothetical protein ACI87J_002160 [Colwellia sp.]|jgi:hypothetical protein|uniref:Oligosaccharide repeat unit polymerase n=1 Tax=Colwellia sp. C1 TaxID=1737566 RepID=A0A0P0LXN7_9GAMM|nr:hypothetical protein [Colwellia sp. C1]
MTRFQVISSTLFASLALFLVFFVYYSGAGKGGGYLFIVSNLAICILCISGLLWKNVQTVSLKNTFFLFTFVFMGTTPFLEYANDISYWGRIKPSYDAMVYANIIVIQSILVFVGSYVIGYKGRIIARVFDRSNRYLSRVVNSNPKLGIYTVFILAIVSCYMTADYNNFNLLSLFYRGGDFDRLEISKSLFLIYIYVIKPIPVMAMLYIWLYKDKKNYKGLLYLLFFMCLIFVAPTSIARFYAVTLYLPLVICYTQFFDRYLSYQISFVFGVLFIFPMLNGFRYYSDKFDISKFSLSYDFFFSGHFDAYQNLAKVVELELITLGHQLLGVIGFAVPRIFWSDKPIGSGAFLAKQEGLFFETISMPLIAEGYLNFGMLGVIMFVFIFGYFAGSLDSFYQNLRIKKEKHFILPIYFIFIGLSLLVLRGDLLSSFAYTVSLTATFIFIILVSIITILTWKYTKKLIS